MSSKALVTLREDWHLLFPLLSSVADDADWEASIRRSTFVKDIMPACSSSPTLKSFGVGKYDSTFLFLPSTLGFQSLSSRTHSPARGEIVHYQQCGKREHSSPFPWSALVLWFHIIVPCLSFPWFAALIFVVNVTVVVFPSCRCMTILRRRGEYFSLASV